MNKLEVKPLSDEEIQKSVDDVFEPLLKQYEEWQESVSKVEDMLLEATNDGSDPEKRRLALDGAEVTMQVMSDLEETNTLDKVLGGNKAYADQLVLESLERVLPLVKDIKDWENSFFYYKLLTIILHNAMSFVDASIEVTGKLFDKYE